MEAFLDPETERRSKGKIRTGRANAFRSPLPALILCLDGKVIEPIDGNFEEVV